LRTIAASLLTWSLLFQAAPVHAAENAPKKLVARGQDIAVAVCAACHRVPAPEADRPILHEPAPDFSKIANLPGMTEEQLTRLIRDPQHASNAGMPNPRLTDEMTGAVVAYILSLKDKP
jgi:mono/diheme cytochrome c family protein